MEKEFKDKILKEIDVFIKNNKEIDKIFVVIKDNNKIKLQYFGLKKRYRNNGIGSKLLNELEIIFINLNFKYIIIDAYKKSINFWKKNGYIIEKKAQIFNGLKQDYHNGYKNIGENYIIVNEKDIIKDTKINDNLFIPIIFIKKNYIYFLLNIEKTETKDIGKKIIKYKENLFIINGYKKLYFKNIYNFTKEQINNIAISLFSTIRFEYFANQDYITIDDKKEFKNIIKEFLGLKKDKIFKIISSYKFVNIPEGNKQDFDNFVYKNKKICNIFSVYKNKKGICDGLSHLLNICFIINGYNSKINYNGSGIGHFWVEDDTFKYDPSYGTITKLR